MDSGLNIPIILASTSPRRIHLLSQVRLPIEVQSPDTDEKPKPRENPTQLVSRLALEKAESVQATLIQRYERCLIIAADTIVVAPDGKKILGKPKDVLDAQKSLKLLAGKTHTVLTGYCILLATRPENQLGNGSEKRTEKRPKKIVRVVKTRVEMRSYDKSVIDRYIALGEPMDKAGAYGAQGLGMSLIKKITGSYTNVVGLPVPEVLADLEKTFKIKLFSWING